MNRKILDKAFSVIGIVVLACSCSYIGHKEKDNEPIVSLWESCGGIASTPDYLLWALWSDGFVVVSKSGKLMSTTIDSESLKELKRKIEKSPLLNDKRKDVFMGKDGRFKTLIVQHSKGQRYIERPMLTSTSPEFSDFIFKWKEFEKIINGVKLSNLKSYDRSRPCTLPPLPDYSEMLY